MKREREYVHKCRLKIRRRLNNGFVVSCSGASVQKLPTPETSSFFVNHTSIHAITKRLRYNAADFCCFAATIIMQARPFYSHYGSEHPYLLYFVPAKFTTFTHFVAMFIAVKLTVLLATNYLAE